MGDIVDCGHWYCVDFLQYVTSIVAIRADIGVCDGRVSSGSDAPFHKTEQLQHAACSVACMNTRRAGRSLKSLENKSFSLDGAVI